MTLLGTYKLTANTQQFSEDRHMDESTKQEGVKDSGDYKVTPGGASLQWSVAAGVAWVQGDTTARQGLYHQVNDAAVTGTVAAGHATLPRLDQVVLQIADSSVTGASNTPTLVTVAGTATAGATLDNRTGAAALPASALLLADILVPAAQSGVLTTGMIRDRRKWARGAYNVVTQLTGADYTTTSLSFAEVDTTNLRRRIECSGVPLRCVLKLARAGGSGAAAAGLPVFQLWVDGASVSGTQGFYAAFNDSSDESSYYIEQTAVPAAGSHLISWAWKVAAAGTATIQRGTDYLVEMEIEELVRQNTSND